MENIKLPVADLHPGMFVCALDRPWLETPFTEDGFKLNSDADIAAVQAYCQFVQIDIGRTEADEVMINAPTGTAFLPAEFGRLREHDLQAAEAVNNQTAALIKVFLEDISLGQSPDIQLAKSAVSECVAGIVGKPEAMMFLARLRSKDLRATQQSVNVCIYSIVLGSLLGLDSTKLENLGTAALLHDVGFLGIPDYLLNKPGRFDDTEMAVMQSHAKRGRDILMSGRTIYSGAVDVAYGHHEHLDGTGYPRGLESHQINLNCRIVAVADKYAALVASRPYRAAADHLSAVSMLRKMAKDSKIDQKLMSMFVAYLGVYPPGCVVELNSGETGIVLASNTKQPLRPQVLIVRDALQGPVQRVVDLAKKTVDDLGRPYRIASVGRPGGFAIDLDQYYDLILHAYG